MNTSRSIRPIVTIAAAIALLAGAPRAFAQSQTTQEQDKATALAAAADDIAFANRLSKAFKTVASTAEPAVVHVTALNNVQQVSYDFFLRPVRRGPARLQATGLGSGVIVSADGYIVTNNHVVRGADALKVKLRDGVEYDAKLVGRDDLTDLAVIQLLPKDGNSPILSPVRFADSESLDVGEWVIAIGSPFGLSNTVTAGIVSAKGRSVTPRETGRVQEDFIQTDAAINPGNSGGPLLNLQGQVVGINSAIASRTGGYEGIGFAIPANTAKAVMENIIANGRVVRAFLGAQLQEATPAELSGRSGPGVVVAGVVEDGPAQRAGLREGDVILRFKGSPVSESKLRNAIGISRPGTSADLEVLRDGAVKTVSVVLGDQAVVLKTGDVPSLGIRVQPVTRETLKNMGLRGEVKGVVVTDVEPEGRAARAEIQPGDIIVSVDGTEISNTQAFADVVAKLDFNRGVRFLIARGVERGYIDVRD